MTDSRNASALFGVLLTVCLIGACSPSGEKSQTVATINLLLESPTEAARCKLLFDDVDVLATTGADGSSWSWFKPDGGPQHFCRKARDGAISAWVEASRNQQATHSLTFDSARHGALFQPVSQP